jgi:hypothetical protein
MHPSRFLIVALLGMAACADNSTKMPQPGSASPMQPPDVQTQDVPYSTKPMYHANGAPSEDPVPPPGAQYTIYAGRVEGPTHVQEADKIKKDLRVTTGMKDWYVIHQASQSLVYYGYYRNVTDPKDSDAIRAKADRAKIDKFVDKTTGQRPFAQAVFQSLDSPDPAAPAEWNILNSKGVYTLQIAVYKGSPERKQAAVDTVRDARAQGVEAYFFHGDNASLVCVGSFPLSAVRINDVAVNNNGDQMQTKMYVPQTNDPSLDKQLEDVARRNGVQLIRPKYEVVDPKLLAAIKQFPYNTVNGMQMEKTLPNGQKDYDHSIVMQIPRGETQPLQPAGMNQDMAATGGILPSRLTDSPGYDPSYRPSLPSMVESAPTQAPQPKPIGGRLRSIGD